jgi:hypothetical protein
MEGAINGQSAGNGDEVETESDEPLLGTETPTTTPQPADADEDDSRDLLLDPIIQQAMEQSDQQSSRKRDPEY